MYFYGCYKYDLEHYIMMELVFFLPFLYRDIVFFLMIFLQAYVLIVVSRSKKLALPSVQTLSC
jgi:hypothetical protein